MQTTRNLRIVETSLLPTPDAIVEEIPATTAAVQTVLDTRRQIQAILDGQDHRKLVVVGPCSIHDPGAALDYAVRLSKLRERIEDDVLLVMRVYFEKPRTTVGWKGLINDPHLDESNDIPTGLRVARKLLCDLNDMGVPSATEMLDPIIPQYLADLVSWTAIGARTTESQTHREMASGLSMPVGFKNGTDGSLSVAIHAMVAADKPHTFLGIDGGGRVGVVRTSGNPYGHLVLRGGKAGPNYSAEHVQQAVTEAALAGVRTRLMIDCSHGNSEKDYRRQPAVLKDVGHQVAQGQEAIIGAMIESHLHAGNQPLCSRDELQYGTSITDGCVDFETTEAMLVDFARHIKERNFARLDLPSPDHGAV